jgi:Sec-independent protein translocase protein TatA
MELGAERFTAWGRDGGELLREFEERVAQAEPEARVRKQRPQTLGGAVEAVSEAPFDPLGRLCQAAP